MTRPRQPNRAKTAIVTGAEGGVGLSSRSFLAAGYSVVALYIDHELLEV